MNYEYQPTCQIPPETLDKIYMDAFGFKRNGTFVEVGAHDGWHWSCSWGLAEIGWTGLYCEPVRSLYEQCLKTNENRDKVTTLHCCIGKTNGVATLGMAEYGASAESEKDRFTVDQFTLDHVLDDMGIPEKFDLLVIDVEGSEADVLEGFDWKKWLPKLIIVERPQEAFNQLLTHYDKVYEDWINTIYQRK